MYNILVSNLKESMEDLKKKFPNSSPLKRLTSRIDEQKNYVKKLNVILDGFYNYLLNEKNLPHKKVDNKINNVKDFLQNYHLDNNEKSLSEINGEYLSELLDDFFDDLMQNNLPSIPPSKMKDMCRSLKIFFKFLKEKLNYFKDDLQYKNIRDSLDAEYEIVELDDEKDYTGEYMNLGGTKVSVKDLIRMAKGMNYSDSYFEREKEKKKQLEEKNKKILRNSINLKEDLKDWYNDKEIETAEKILDRLIENYHAIKNLKKSFLLAAIDYTLKDIYEKKFSQTVIAKRHGTSINTLIKTRSIISPYIPLELFYRNFLSEAEINSNKEKTYTFKVINNYDRGHWAKFELLVSQTLEDLNELIQRYLFDLDEGGFIDHLYSFYMSGKEWDEKSEYCGPPESQKDYSNRNTLITLKELNIGYKQKFLYLYDYGACHKFSILVIGIGIYNDKKKYPLVIDWQ